MALAVVAWGGAQWATDAMVDHTKLYLDSVLIQQSARNRVVFTYDVVERGGLLKVRVRNPRFVGRADNNQPYTVRTSEVLIAQRGIERVRVTFPDALEFTSPEGTLLLLGDDSIQASMLPYGPDALPEEVELLLPHYTTARVLDQGKHRVGSYTLQSRNMRLGLRRRDADHFESWLEGRDIGMGEETAPRPVARMGMLELSGSLAKHENLAFDVEQKFVLNKLEFLLPPTPVSESVSDKGSGMSLPIDLGWTTKARIDLFVDAPENQAGQASAPGLQYLVESLHVKEAYLRMASLPLVKAKGEMHATREQPEPVGAATLTFGAFPAIESLLKTAAKTNAEKNRADQTSTYLTVVEGLERKLESLGRRVNKNEVEVVVSRKAGETLKVGTVDYDAALTQILQATLGATGLNMYMEAPGIGRAPIIDPEGATGQSRATPGLPPIGTFGSEKEPLPPHESTRPK